MPGAFNQPPPGFGLGLQGRLGVGLGGQDEQLVGEPNPPQRLLSFVDEEPGVDVGAVDFVEGVDDVVEAEQGGGRDEFVVADRARVEVAARSQQPTARRGGLGFDLLRCTHSSYMNRTASGSREASWRRTRRAPGLIWPMRICRTRHGTPEHDAAEVLRCRGHRFHLRDATQRRRHQTARRLVGCGAMASCEARPEALRYSRKRVQTPDEQKIR